MSEFAENLNFSGVIIGLSTFIIIGLFHPLVIKGYYYLGLKCRWLFLIAGIISLILCILASNTLVSVLLGVTAFSCFWSIKEISEQKERVDKGWFPANPRHEKKQ